MTQQSQQSMTLLDGLSSERVARYARLVAGITDCPLAGLPWLAPALLLSDPQVDIATAFPTPGADEILIHDYQSITYAGSFEPDQPLEAQLTAAQKSSSIEFTVDLNACVTLKTALRCVPKTTLVMAKPLAVREKDIQDAMTVQGLTCSQAQIDQYLDLSGDDNPIHRAGHAARALGLRGPIVPGQLLVALVQPILEHSRPNAKLSNFRARFIAPICVNDPFSISVQARGDASKNRAFLHSKGSAFAIVDLTLT